MDIYIASKSVNNKFTNSVQQLHIIRLDLINKFVTYYKAFIKYVYIL